VVGGGEVPDVEIGAAENRHRSTVYSDLWSMTCPEHLHAARRAVYSCLAHGPGCLGQVIDQKIEYTVAAVPGFGRSYFNIGHLAAADHYQ